MKQYKNKDVLVTGGAGSIGSELVRQLSSLGCKRVRILDVNESAEYELEKELCDRKNVRYLLGCVRDYERVLKATKGVDIVFHCAAFKHVPKCEYDAQEAVKTNVMGIINVINACKANRVGKMIMISTDKAVNPTNVMGITKLLSEKLVLNAKYDDCVTKFAVVRFGNVLNSRGSVIPIFQQQIERGGPITLTRPDMNRFFMKTNQAVGLVLEAGAKMAGGETFILKMPVLNVLDLASVLIEASNKKIDIECVGMRVGEKLNEALLTEEESLRAKEDDRMIVISQVIDTPHVQKADYQEAGIVRVLDSVSIKPVDKNELRKVLKDEGII